SLMESDGERGRQIDDEARSFDGESSGDAPSLEEIAGEEGLQLLTRIAVVDERAGRHARDRDALDLAIGIDWVAHLRGHIRKLLLRRTAADHGAVGADHANPVERELLVAGREAPAELVVVLDRLGLEDLHNLPEGLGAATI